MSPHIEPAGSPNRPAPPGQEPPTRPLAWPRGIARDRIVLLLLAVLAVALSLPLLPNSQGARAGNVAIPLPTEDPNSVMPSPTPTTDSSLATPTPTQVSAGVPAAPASTVPAQATFVTSTPTAIWTPPAPGATATWTPVPAQEQFVPSLPEEQAATVEALETAAFEQPLPPPPATAPTLPGTGLVPPPPPAEVVPTVPAAPPPPTPTPILGIVVVPPPAQVGEPVADQSFDLALFIDNLVVAFGYVWIACGLLLLPLVVIGGLLLVRRPRPPYTPVHIPQPPQPPAPQAGVTPPPPPPPAPPPPAQPAATGGSQRVAARHRSNGGNGGNDSERPPG